MNLELKQFISNVRKQVPLTYNKLLKQAQGIVEGKSIDAILTKIELSGSYSQRSKKQPTENSDIDLLVTYRGTAEPEQLVKALAGKLYGEFGFYDVQAQKENSAKYIEKFYTMGHARNLLVSIYVNPSTDELDKYMPIGARAFISTKGDLYVEGYEEEEKIRMQHLSSITHGVLIKIILSKNPTLVPPNIDIETIWGSDRYGISVQRYMDTNTFYIGEAQPKFKPEFLKLAQRKNPRLQFSEKNITEMKDYIDTTNWGTLRDESTDNRKANFIRFFKEMDSAGIAPYAPDHMLGGKPIQIQKPPAYTTLQDERPKPYPGSDKKHTATKDD